MYRKCARFARWIDDCELIDLGFSGPKFTWSRGYGLRKISIRLDRALANASWRSLFPEATVSHLPNIYSDHTPLLIDLLGAIPLQIFILQRPFRFQAAWLTHLEFRPFFVMDSWENSLPLNEALVSFTEKVKVWNKQVFGNIH